MVDKSLADKLVSIAIKQIKIGVDFRQPRLDSIKKIEDVYFGRKKPTLKNRLNVPIDTTILGGFVDTLMSKIDDAPQIIYGHTEEADLIPAKKVSAMWEVDKNKVSNRWNQKDRLTKKLAVMSGRSIVKYFAESDPQYKSNLEVIDYNDFVCEPQGGFDLENHLFCGQMNIFRTIQELEASSLYDQSQIQLFKVRATDEGFKINEDLHKNKDNRFNALGLDPVTNNYVGVPLVNLTEWYMVYNNKRYYLLFDYTTGVWVRVEELKDVFESGLYPFVSWATHEDPFNFWSKSPCDDIYPISESMRLIFNEAINNLRKNNGGQRAIDPNMFPDLSQLEWKEDGIVLADTKLGTKRIGDGVYEFQTPDRTNLIVNLNQYLDGLLGQKTGITAGSQGQSDKDTKVGVYYGDMQQVADRIGLYNKSYSEAWEGLGIRYVWGLKEHLSEPMAVKMVGQDGVEWDDLRKEEINPDFDIKVVGGNSEEQLNEVKNQKKIEALNVIISNPNLVGLINPNWANEQILRNGNYGEEEIRAALDTSNYGNQFIISEAARENQKLLLGKMVEPNRKAIPAHLQKHLDFAMENSVKPDVFNNIMQHIELELPFAIENSVRKGMITKGMQMATPPQKTNPMTPPANTMAGTASQSQGISNMQSPL